MTVYAKKESRTRDAFVSGSDCNEADRLVIHKVSMREVEVIQEI